MKPFLSFLSIFSYAFCFSQTDWTFAASSVDNIEYFIKDSRKLNSSNVYTFWVKAQFPDKKIKNKKGQFITVPGKYSVGSWEINCVEKESKLDRVISYNNKGIVTGDDNMFSGWNKIVPDSIAESIFELVCIRPE